MQIENGTTAYFDLGFSIGRKCFIMGPDFGDFRAAIFDLACSTATSFKKGGHFLSSRENLRDKIPRRVHDPFHTDQDICIRDTVTHKPAKREHELRRKGTHDHTRA